MTNKYCKKPVIVEAEQWFPGKHVEGVTEMVRLGSMCDTARRYDHEVSAGYGTCVTIHGQPTKVMPGDWVITEPDGIHHYPCKPEIFAATYEPVEDERREQNWDGTW